METPGISFPRAPGTGRSKRCQHLIVHRLEAKTTCGSFACPSSFPLILTVLLFSPRKSARRLPICLLFLPGTSTHLNSTQLALRVSHNRSLICSSSFGNGDQRVTYQNSIS